ncbi:hypothetical protein MBGDF03_00999 [Thermoplasmatales archaeon SCGC AB-540-F20]|nr:hypothetical protein MBGDF03_00999 [Thermoplasmatales archaeon SCGC AB-540-F20]
MTEEKEITCIVCPIGCKILVKTDGKHIKTLMGISVNRESIMQKTRPLIQDGC